MKPKGSGFKTAFDSSESKGSVESEDPWIFTSTGSASLDADIKRAARPMAAETEWKMEGGKPKLIVLRTAVNQEPTFVERMLQKHRGHAFKGDHRRAALEARLAISCGRFPLTRDEVAESLSEAYRAYYGVGEHAGDPRPYTKTELAGVAELMRLRHEGSLGIGKPKMETAGMALMRALKILPVADPRPLR